LRFDAPLTRPQQEREDQLDRNTSIRVSDELPLVKYDEAELVEQARRTER